MGYFTRGGGSYFFLPGALITLSLSFHFNFCLFETTWKMAFLDVSARDSVMEKVTLANAINEQGSPGHLDPTVMRLFAL